MALVDCAGDLLVVSLCKLSASVAVRDDLSGRGRCDEEVDEDIREVAKSDGLLLAVLLVLSRPEERGLLTAFDAVWGAENIRVAH